MIRSFEVIVSKERLEEAKRRVYEATKSCKSDDVVRYLMQTSLCKSCKYFSWEPDLLCGVNPSLADQLIVEECEDFVEKNLNAKTISHQRRIGPHPIAHLH